MKMRSVILALAGALALVGCGSDDDSTAGNVTQTNGGSVGSLVVTIPNISAPNAGSGNAGLLDGIIKIGPECITWTGVSNEPVLLVWHEGSVTLSDDDSSLTFTSPVAGSEPVLVEDRDSVDLGGTPAPGSLEYIHGPYASCPNDAFVVTEIRRPAS